MKFMPFGNFPIVSIAKKNDKSNSLKKISFFRVKYGKDDNMRCKKPTSKTHTISKGPKRTVYKRHDDGQTIIVNRKSKNRK